MKFFFDNTFSQKLVRFIGELAREEEIHVSHLRDKYDPSTKDQTWIQGLASEGGWVVITEDTRLARSPAAIALLQESGLSYFIFPKDFPRKDRWEQSWRTIKIWPDILQKAKKKPSGAIFSITGNYRIKE